MSWVKKKYRKNSKVIEKNRKKVINTYYETREKTSKQTETKKNKKKRKLNSCKIHETEIYAYTPLPFPFPVLKGKLYIDFVKYQTMDYLHNVMLSGKATLK